MGTIKYSVDNFDARTYREGGIYGGTGSVEDYGGSEKFRRVGPGANTDGSTANFVLEIKLKFPVAVSDFTLNLVMLEVARPSALFYYSVQEKSNDANYRDAIEDSVQRDGEFKFSSTSTTNPTTTNVSISREDGFEADKYYYIYIWSSLNVYEVTHSKVLIKDSSVDYTEKPGLSLPGLGYINVNGTYREIEDGYANIDGAWHELVEIYGNNAGEWVDMSKFSESVSESSVVETIVHTIGINDTYRYCNLIDSGAWTKVSNFRSTGDSNLVNINYFGQGSQDHNSMMIPIPAFNFSGESVGLYLQFNIYVSDNENHTFRWAITNSRSNENVYKGYGSVSDDNQLVAGTFTPVYKGNVYSYQTVYFKCDSIQSGEKLYLYIWRENTKYGNCHVKSDMIVALEHRQ